MQCQPHCVSILKTQTFLLGATSLESVCSRTAWPQFRAWFFFLPLTFWRCYFSPRSVCHRVLTKIVILGWTLVSIITNYVTVFKCIQLAMILFKYIQLFSGIKLFQRSYFSFVDKLLTVENIPFVTNKD